MIPSLFENQAAMSTLSSLGRLNPHSKVETDIITKMMNLAAPVMKVYQIASDSVRAEQKLEEVGKV